MITRRSVVRGGLAISGLAASGILPAILTSCAQKAPTAPLRIGLVEWPGYAPFYLAQELGYYGNAPIELITFVDIADIMRAYRQQQIDAICTSLSDVMQLAEVIPDQRLVLMIDESDGADAILAKPSIKSLSDLKGRRIGSDLSILSSFILVAALQKANLTLKDVEIVSVGISGQVQAYAADRIDAVIAFDPSRSQLLRVGAKVIFDSSQIPGEIVDVMAVPQTTLTQHTPTLQIVTQGFFKALEYLKQNPEDAIARMCKRQKMTPDEFRKALALLPLSDYQMNQKMLDQVNSPLISATQDLNQIMMDAKLIQKPVDIRPLLTKAALLST
jgi:NitT/TauT family transport system substrate-binding protein